MRRLETQGRMHRHREPRAAPFIAALDGLQRQGKPALRAVRQAAGDREALRHGPEPGRRPAARLPGRCHRPGPDPGADPPGGADPAGPGAGRPGHDRGPGPRAAQRDPGQHPAAEEPLQRRALLRPGTAGHRHRPGLRPHHRRHRRRHCRLAPAPTSSAT
ncbi:MAG: hypothetical protein MZU91_04680 [Desulfosudis oleivorans]|nr:hypothetical protein [Desulfosudis oleivorans]